jgi:hypothetical protein
MFRDCYFEYAGVYSGDYNLVMEYVENSYDSFDSGGKYEATTSTLPATAESLLYGLKYSENPLEFSVEIINPDGAIPFEQMIEIKNWLFGQDGWKKLHLEDPDFNPYHLKCLLVPDQDITDASGYRGLRCTVKNISPFWYGERVNIEFGKDDLLADESNVDKDGYFAFSVNIDSSANKIFPIISFNYSPPSSINTVKYNLKFSLINETNNSAICSVSTIAQRAVTTVNTKYLDGFIPIVGTDMYYDIFYLSAGTNNLKILCKTMGEDNTIQSFSSINFSYEPAVRIGGF